MPPKPEAAPVPIETVREFWDRNPVAEAAIGTRQTPYDYFRAFDNLREAADVEPYAFSNRIHGYESSAGLRVLDYGCGNGYVLAHYARSGALVYGVDLTDAALTRAQARFRLLGQHGIFARGDGSSIPFRSNSFDIVCSMGVLHHVSNPGPIVDELHRVLRPGGRFIGMLYHRDSFRYRVTFRWRKYFGGPQFRGRSIDEICNMNDGPECPLARVYSRAEARELLAAFGEHEFIVNKLGAAELGLFVPALGGIAGRVLPARAIAALAGTLGWNLYIRATKAVSR